MKAKKKYFLISLISVVVCVAVAFAGLIATRGDWRYRAALVFRDYPEPDLREQLPAWEMRTVSLQNLFEDDRVHLTDNLWMINAGHAIPEEKAPQLIEESGFRMTLSTWEAFGALNSAVTAATGTGLYIRSAWRGSAEQQEELEQQGSDIAAKPGHSEHESGLALDICVSGYGGMSFLKTAAGRYVNDHCGEYGFIIRYPQGKSGITGISYEPWHLRYVGEPHARVIMESGLTLEEYFDHLTPDIWFQSGEYWILRTAAEEIPVPAEFVSCTVSEDLCGYYILTFRM